MFKFEDICKLYGTYSASFVDNGIDRLKQPKKKLRRKFITRNIYEIPSRLNYILSENNIRKNNLRSS